ncbi:MAG: hypothetical protein CMH54_11665 [Myxococcales bacterium]|nr:hypothetical protein [Myxococcales bacterium]
MPGQGRLGDSAHCPADGHGCLACTHSVIGPAVSGSPDVEVNGMAALRTGDPGVHGSCCGPNKWVATGCSGTVFINGLGAHRMGDLTTHCGGKGVLVVASEDVIVG